MNDQATQPAFMRRDNPAFIVAADNMAELEQAAQDDEYLRLITKLP